MIVRPPFPSSLAAPAGAAPRRRMRATNVCTMCRLYSALPRWSVRGCAAWAARLAAASIASAVSGWPARAAAASLALMVEPPDAGEADAGAGDRPCRAGLDSHRDAAVAKSPTRRSSLR